MNTPSNHAVRDYENLKRRAVDMANANRDRMNGTTGPVKEIIAENDIVFAVWQDAEEPNGVGMKIIKGEAALARLAAGKSSETMRISAIPCDCLEQAVAVHKVLGEPDRRN